MTGARVLVIQPVPYAPVGRLGEWWQSGGLDIDVLSLADGDVVPPPEAVAGWDGVVVMGGPMGANDDAEFPWIADVKRLLAQTSSDGVPTLGVCLGHQLLAVACGGQVARNDAGIQAGLRRVELRPGAQADPLHGGLGDDSVAVQWNNDVVVELPVGATVLASTPEGVPQAIRTGTRAWGVQFHPEVDVRTVRDWADRDVQDGSVSPVLADQLLAEIERADASLVACWRPWAARFAAVVARYAAAGVTARRAPCR